ncbi:kinase-like domain-containing protein [Baffinella frigidus]|nr:kinase-like domain-containing protein [Cryptophyta sp. CCMP2293]
MENFRVLRKLGEGAFGEVLLAEDTRSGAHVALKKIFLRNVDDGLPIGVWREFKALQHAEHPNVVKLSEVVVHGAALVLVMERLHCSLADVISFADAALGEARCKAYALGVLKGLAHMHALRIVHRDIKPGNILVGAHGQVKLADFGLARMEAAPERGFSYQAATRWYRPPEMLYASRSYDTKVDLWGAGCVVAELLTLSPLFPGETDIDQLHRVFTLRGTPDAWMSDWPEVVTLPDFDKISFAEMQPGSLAARLGGLGAAPTRLVDSLLQVPPNRRPSAEEALRDPWFVMEPPPAVLADCALPPLPERGAKGWKPPEPFAWADVVASALATPAVGDFFPDAGC